MPAALLAVAAAVADLQALGAEVRSEMARRLPAATPAAADDIPALGACKRVVPDERAKLAKLVVPAKVDETYYVRFGCEEAGGVIVEASYDLDRKGHWKIVRVAGSRVTAIVDFQGLSIMDYMEWANEVSVSVGALVDIDGDGTHDALVIRNIHEGGAVHNDQELSLWSSRTGRVTPLGSFSDSVGIAIGQLAPPIVLQVFRNNNDEPPHYRCLEASGVIDLCPAIEGARHTDRVLEIASWFVEGHEYGIDKAKVPDRELLAEMLGELAVPAARRAQLLAEVPATRREQRVAREIERWLASTEARKYGELVLPQPADKRAAEITALAGDQPCTMSAADGKRAKAAVTRWIAAHETPATPTIVASCGDLESGYVHAHWSYEDKKAGELTARDVVLDFTHGAATVLATATAKGPNYTCGACGFAPPGDGLDASFFRHDGKRLAVMFEVTKDQQPMLFAIDGKLAAGPTGTGLAWARLREPESALRTVLESGGTGVAFWHWDGEWKKVADVPLTISDPPADLAGLGLRLWRESMRVYAIWALQRFDAKAWAGNKSVRAETRLQLIAAGADAELLARIEAE